LRNAFVQAVSADELLVCVADETARQQVSLDEHLEAVADAEDGHALPRGVLDLGHDRGERRDGTGTKVVAVREAARQDDRVDALEIVRAVPQRDRLGTRHTDRALGITVVERTRERDDADAGSHQTTSMLMTSSMTWFERISSATFLASASTSSVTSPSTVISTRLPMRTFWNWP
jgi:hypothetical protein